MRVQRGGDPVHPGTPRRDVAARRALLPSWRWGGCALLWSDGGSEGFSSSFHPLDKHICASPHPSSLGARCCAHEGVRTRGSSSSSSSSSWACTKPCGVCSCPIPHPAHKHGVRWLLSWLSCLALLSPHVCDLPKFFYIYIYIFVSSQENWGQTYFLRNPFAPPCQLYIYIFFSRHILHYVKHRWRNMFGKSALPLCLQQLGLDLAAYLIKGGSCTFYSFL